MVDLLGPYSTTEKGNKYLMVVICQLTGYTILSTVNFMVVTFMVTVNFMVGFLAEQKTIKMTVTWKIKKSHRKNAFFSLLLLNVSSEKFSHGLLNLTFFTGFSTISHSESAMGTNSITLKSLNHFCNS